jgi:hypothetical protein
MVGKILVFPQTVSEVLQAALGTLQQWCDKTRLSINSNKMIVIPFTRKRNFKGFKEAVVFGNRIQLSSEVKYLGITLNKGLTWKKQLEKVTDKAYKAFWTGILDIHCSRKTHTYLCCHYMVAQSPTQNMPARTQQVAKDGLPGTGAISNATKSKNVFIV